MEYAFTLQICVSSENDISFLENILGLQGTEMDETQWKYTIEVGVEDDWIDFVDVFYKSLNGKFEILESIGVKKGDITIWYYYEYDQQCNMEFSPENLSKLAELGITLCISCWEKGLQA